MPPGFCDPLFKVVFYNLIATTLKSYFTTLYNYNFKVVFYNLTHNNFKVFTHSYLTTLFDYNFKISKKL